jgi:hypothetical protein
MKPGFLIILCACIIAIFCSAPVGATLVLSGVSFTPNPPPVPGQSQQVAAILTIIPSGAATFEKGHEIQMTTPLEHAQWNVQVIVDGIPAARQSATGSAAFVNGVLISYPTSRDVAVSVTIDGAVPAGTGPDVQILQAEELDNSGNIVPGSVITITRPIAGVTGSVTNTPGLALTPVIAPISPTPTKAPGFSPVTVLLAISVISAIAGYSVSQRNDR